MITLEFIKSKVIESLVDSIPEISGKLDNPELNLMIDNTVQKIMDELKLSIDYIEESGNFIALEEEINEKLGN